jgi:SAM-dependent methyltransferase
MAASDYQQKQTEKYLSHEADSPKWKEGQVRFVRGHFEEVPRDLRIIDVGCGDGCGLEVLRDMGFKGVVGVELADKKIERACTLGFPVFKADMHDLSFFGNGTFNIVYSSHTLEHAYDPVKVLREFHRILKPHGILVLVLPYPDTGTENHEAHCGKFPLHTDMNDDAKSLEKVLSENGFLTSWKQYDSYREPEVWLRAFRA